jgi:hypothetical protein
MAGEEVAVTRAQQGSTVPIDKLPDTQPWQPSLPPPSVPPQWQGKPPPAPPVRQVPQIVLPTRLAVIIAGLLTATLLLATMVLTTMLFGIYDLGPMAGWWRENCTTLCVQTPGTGAYPNPPDVIHPQVSAGSP